MTDWLQGGEEIQSLNIIKSITIDVYLILCESNIGGEDFLILWVHTKNTEYMRMIEMLGFGVVQTKPFPVCLFHIIEKLLGIN